MGKGKIMLDLKRKKRRKPRTEFKYEDFRVVTELDVHLAQYLRTFLHIDISQWNFCMDIIRQGRAYTTELRSKGKGKGTRKIYKPHNALKVVQRAIKNRILKQIPVHFARHGGPDGTSTMTNVAQHAGFAKAVFSVDLVNAYPSVTRYRVKRNLEKPISFLLKQFMGVEFSKDDVEKMIEAICDLTCYHDRVQQGLPSSARMLDICCMKLDMDIFKLLHDQSSALQKYRYTAFVDDLTISSNDEITIELMQQIIDTIEANGFIPHIRKDKTKYFSRKSGEVPEVTGLVVNDDGRITMAKGKVNQIRGTLFNICKQVKWTEEDLNRVRGLIAYVNMVYPDKLPSKLKKIVDAAQLRVKAEQLARFSSSKPVEFSAAQDDDEKEVVSGILYTDGASKKGIGTVGVVLQKEGRVVREISSVIGAATNNQAEYQALITGMEAALEENVTALDCFFDSKLIYNQLSKSNKVQNKKLKVLYDKVQRLCKKFDMVRFHYIPREKNKTADKLSKKALKSLPNNFRLGDVISLSQLSECA